MKSNYRTGIEIKLTNFNNFKVIYGTINKNNPKSIYLNLSCWCKLNSNDDDHISKKIDKIRTKLKKFIFSINSNNYIIPKSIIDFKLSDANLKIGKPSFLSCEITFYPNKNITFNSDIHLSELNQIQINLSNFLINELNKHNLSLFH